MAEQDRPGELTSGSINEHPLTLARWAFLLAGIPFFIGGAIVIRTEVPPSLSPTLGMVSHLLWAIAIAGLAVGAVAMLRAVETLRTGVSGYLAVGTLGLGVLHGFQWVSWAYVDVRGAREGEHERILDTVIVPFGASHLLVYALFLAGGVVLLSVALRRSTLTSRRIDWSGLLLGTVTITLACSSLLFALGGGDDGHPLFDITTLLLPVLYLWAVGLGITLSIGG